MNMQPMGDDLPVAAYDATSSQWYHSNEYPVADGLEGPFNTRLEAEQSLADYIIWVEEGGDDLVRN